MKILIISPLFPPDTGAPAQYVKTLVPQLIENEVTLMIYGYLPESVANTKIIMLDKRWSKIKLLLKSFLEIIKVGRDVDLIVINNGPSTELPALLASLVIKTSMTLCVSDPLAEKSSRTGIYAVIHKLFLKRVNKTITLPENENAYLPAEILPFTDNNTETEVARKHWWKEHVAAITTI